MTDKSLSAIKTVIVDLDRTLLHTDKTLSPYTVSVLGRCREQGIQVMVATARPLRTALPYCDQLAVDAMTVSNGARVICGKNRTEFGICQTSAERLLNALLAHSSLKITLETGDEAYSNLPIEEYETVLTDDLIGTARREGALKILVHREAEGTLAIVENALSEDLYYTVAHGTLIQIMSREATKWNGIRAMLSAGGSSPEVTAYFGDDNDDREPICLCGLGVAVANGLPEIKAAADRITASNDEDGVAAFIEQYLLK